MYISFPKFDQPIPMSRVKQVGTHKAYHTGLVLVPSDLCPNCLAQDRLQLWCPFSSWSGNTGHIEVSESDLERILNVINVSWARGTRDVYGACLLVYHIFCDSHNIAEEDRSPTSLILIIAFNSSCAGLYAGGTLVNYVFAICAWHILHGLAWSMEDIQVKAALTGTAILVPLTSREPQWQWSWWSL